MVGGLDGSAALGGRVGELSPPADAELFRSLRALGDVVLVGAETVRREGYGPVRLPEALRRERGARGRPEVPRVAVVTGSLAFDWEIPLFRDAAPEARPILLAPSTAAPDAVAAAAAHAEVRVAGEHRVDLVAALDRLADHGATVVWCEGGPHLLGELVGADLLDELCLTVAPVMGGDPLPVSVSPPGGERGRFALRHVAADGDTVFLRYERAERSERAERAERAEEVPG
jgi:riboflavin biosynthesis pyrimidine reductase